MRYILEQHRMYLITLQFLLQQIVNILHFFTFSYYNTTSNYTCEKKSSVAQFGIYPLSVLPDVFFLAEDNVDLLRDLGGVAFLYNLSKSSNVHSDVKETALFTLGTLSEANGGYMCLRIIDFHIHPSTYSCRVQKHF